MLHMNHLDGVPWWYSADSQVARKPQDDFRHMHSALERTAGRLSGVGPLLLLVLESLHVASPAEKIKFFDGSSGFEEANRKLSVLLKARLRTGIKSLHLNPLVKTVQANQIQGQSLRDAGWK